MRPSLRIFLSNSWPVISMDRTYLCDSQAMVGTLQPGKKDRSAAGQLAADDRGTCGERLQFGEGGLARDVFHAAVGGGDQPLRWQVGEGGTDAGRDGLCRLRLGVAHADDAEDHGLVAEAVEGGEIEIGLGGLDRDLLDLRGRELRQERIAVRLVAGDIGVAEAEVQRRRSGEPSRARSIAGNASRRASSARACSQGSSSWITSAPAAFRSRSSALTAAA